MVDTASGAYAHEHLMSDSFMERALYYQAAAIWPREQILFERWGLHRLTRVVDLGCGTGEICSRTGYALSWPAHHRTRCRGTQYRYCPAASRPSQQSGFAGE